MWNPDFPETALGSRIETEEQAKNWVMDLVAEVEAVRADCDAARMVQEQRKSFVRWMIKRGESLGVLHALQRTGKLSDTAFTELRQRVLATQVPLVQKGVLPF